ncbi:hypothetical protein BDN70DRAFT_872956 [Pholiota conissans]|uniref:Uncharacterized protein n=1 Tax=Pholiota conissans TaxID=109636 RepID=A0A9P6D5W7_9AGAR|nr:hypothetical protein BDN70DRAFT_872956 [Pholiota conissans]
MTAFSFSAWTYLLSSLVAEESLCYVANEGNALGDPPALKVISKQSVSIPWLEEMAKKSCCPAVGSGWKAYAPCTL